MYLDRSVSRFAFAGAALVALALIVLTAAPAAAGNANVTVGDSFFNPNQVTIQAGDSVTWTKPQTTLPHNVFFIDSGVSCANGCSDTGGNGAATATPWQFTRTFNTPGTINYRCSVHGVAMSGQIVVEGGGAPGSLRFSSASYSVGEGSGSATITVQRVGGDNGAVSVQYTTGNGTATAGSDYVATSGTLSWADNDDNSKSFAVPILEDTADEPNESVNLTLASPTGGATLGSPSSAVLIITDNDDPAPGPTPGSLSFTTAAQDVQEGAGNATVTVRRTGGTSGAVSVQYESGGGTATAGDDYTAVSGVLSWAGGDGANKTFLLPILDDTDAEGSENVNLTLSDPTGGATLGTPVNQSVTILDDDSVEPGPCIEGPNTLCLLNDRFRVEVTFTPPGGVQQPANAIPFTNRAGMVWFFNEENIEMLVKMQNACIPAFNRFWVFFAATTNVGFEVVVTDTDELQQRRYSNPQGMVALPVADTDAFATCP